MIILPETKVAGANRVAHKLRQSYVQWRQPRVIGG
jgi:hypothetical protein